MDKPPLDGIQQRPRSGATRCPFCHDECEPGLGACACADCLSRHHLGCWDEAGGCSSCRSTNRLVATNGGAATKSDPNYSEVVDAWFKLWAFYNGTLTVLTLLMLRSTLFTGHAAFLVAQGALFANFCFMAGPGFELALRVIGARETRALRWVLFGLGFLVAVGLAIGSCAELVMDL